ncbi:MAG: (2Fe-2S)-binding protein [Bacteroidetes bacterium]|nr:(2Fe-2S)-binding protein [Bacteroidota bacterium]
MKNEVRKCICSNVTFEEMKAIAEHNNVASIEELCSFVNVASNCKLCTPYILKMLETGKTRFETDNGFN